MTREQLRTNIENLQEEINRLTDMDTELTNNYILKISAQLDILIVEFYKLVS